MNKKTSKALRREEQLGFLEGSEKRANEDYIWRTNQRRIEHLAKCLHFHLFAYLARLACVPYEPDTIEKYWVLLPYMAIAIPLAIGIYVYTKRVLSPSKSKKREDSPNPGALEEQIVKAGLAEAALSVTTLPVVHAIEYDPQMRVAGFVTMLMILLYIHYNVIRNVTATLVLLSAFGVFFWWSCARPSASWFVLCVWALALTLGSLQMVGQFLQEERKQYLRTWRLDRDKHLYQDLLQTLQDPVLIVEPHRLVFANVRADSQLHISSLNYQEVLERFVAAERPTLWEQARATLAAENPIQVQEQNYTFIQDSNHEKQSYKAHIITSKHMSAEKMLAIVLHDLTEERLAEQRKAKARYENLLLFAVSHELRTPLNGIQGLLSFMKALPETTRNQRRLIAEAKAWCMYLSNDVGNILDYTHISLDNFALHPLRTELPTLLKRLLKQMSRCLGEKKERVQISLTPTSVLPMEAYVDSTRLEQILRNILSCSVQRVEQGRININVHTVESCLGIEFEVKDNGQPYDEKLLQAIYRSAESSQPPAKDPKDISTLKLIVSCLLATKMGGELLLHSQPETGTATILRIPYLCPFSRNRPSRKLSADWGEDIDEHRPPTHVPRELGVQPSLLSQSTTKAGHTQLRANLHALVNKKQRVVSARNSVARVPFNELSSPGSIERTLLVVDDVEMNRAVLVHILPLSYTAY